VLPGQAPGPPGCATVATPSLGRLLVEVGLHVGDPVPLRPLASGDLTRPAFAEPDRPLPNCEPGRSRRVHGCAWYYSPDGSPCLRPSAGHHTLPVQ